MTEYSMLLQEGAPDGMTIDSEGNLWVALFGGSAIACYSPAGEQLRKIHIPTKNVTCPVFGGPELDTIYVTTTKKMQEDIPGAGGIFAVKVPGIKGRCAAYTANVGIRPGTDPWHKSMTERHAWG